MFQKRKINTDKINLFYIHKNSTTKNFILDVSIFIGAKSSIGQSSWFWNNGTIINNPNFPSPSSSVCQVMTWPLTYTDGINLLPKNCQSGKSYYVAKLKCKYQFNLFNFNLLMFSVPKGTIYLGCRH